MNDRIAKLSEAYGDSEKIIERINRFYGSLADTKRQPEQTFKEYWFPAQSVICCK